MLLKRIDLQQSILTQYDRNAQCCLIYRFELKLDTFFEGLTHIMNKHTELKRAAIGGTIAVVVIAIGNYSVGSLGEVEAMKSIQDMRPSLRVTCSAILSAATTILIIILTLLSFTKKADEQFSATHYSLVEWIVRLSTITFIASLFLLLLLNVPMNTAKDKLMGWYDWLYYIFLAYSALLGGLMVTIVLMLYQAAVSIIMLFHPDKEAKDMLADDEKQDTNEKEAKDPVKQLFNEENRTRT